MFSTDISYDEAASAIQKLDPAMRADYEENLSRLRKAETAYADEDGRQIIGYMDLALSAGVHHAGARCHKISSGSGA